MDKIVGRDIVIVGLQPWDTEIGSNCKNIALEFSKLNRVLYVNSPLDRITKLRGKGDGGVKKRIDILEHPEKNIENIADNLWVFYPDVVIESINWIKVNFIFDMLNRFNGNNISKSIKRAIKVLNFRDVILFNDNDIFRSFYLKEYLQPSLSIYYSRDYLLGVDYWKYHGKRLEPKLISKSDLCVANSSYLAAMCKKYNDASFDVGQGCEIDLFLNAENDSTPQELVNMPIPIVGYVGALQSLRLDIDTIGFIAQANPTWSIVLVGPEDEAFRESILHRMSNVYFLGSKMPDQLPGYINGFTVCINPQLVNEVTIGNYPRKIDEYLAVGKPVVATLTKAMDLFKSHCYLAESKEQYVSLIESAMKDDNADLHTQRKVFASTHTWENSVGAIYAAILSVINK